MERAITLVTDVKDLSELLSGSSLDEARLVPSGSRLALVLELTRAMVELKPTARPGLFRRVKTPWTKCRLTFTGIAAVTVKRLTDLAPDHLPLLSCEAVPGGYQLTIQAPDGLQFIMTLEQLQGSFADVGSPIESP